MPRRLYMVPVANGIHHVCFDTGNGFGFYGATLMWFVKWEVVRLRRLARGKAIPYPQNEQTFQQIQAVAALIREREALEGEWGKQKLGTYAAQLRDQIEQVQREITVLSTPEICWAERYWEEIHRQNALRAGLIVLGQRLGTSPVEMGRFVDACELAVMVLAQWDKSPDWETGQENLLKHLANFYFEILRRLEDFQTVAESAGIRDCSPKPETASGETQAPIPAPALEQLAEAIGDDTAATILAIAKRQDWSAERKMQEIIRIDRRFAGKDSQEWAKLLGVSAPAIRQTNTWKQLRKKRTAE